MTAANVNVTPSRLAPLGGAGSDGTRIVFISVAKAAQNDTATLSNIKELITVSGVINDGSTALTTETITATNAGVITLTSAATGTAHLIAIVR